MFSPKILLFSKNLFYAIVVTTVAVENRMTTHAIFFLIYGCSMSGTVFKKKLRPSKRWWRRQRQRRRQQGPRSTPQHQGAATQKQWRTRVHAHSPLLCDSRNLLGVNGVLSRHWNPSKPLVSQAMGVHGENGSGEMRMYLTLPYFNSPYTLPYLTSSLTLPYILPYLASPYLTLSQLTLHLTLRLPLPYLTSYLTLPYLTLP